MQLEADFAGDDRSLLKTMLQHDEIHIFNKPLMLLALRSNIEFERVMVRNASVSNNVVSARHRDNQ